ncbi:glutaredoxin family protein [Aurantiacibacter poecillastricola]|uniref:glutaredoxin family protein n=1 Tax=Aurantiacibacter poecillastricola TaxID=3064385 RepID=UPI00273D11D9|nr:glutaredoxin family protein [Aurantiacibacter sp. 219JJ12-13]MDP5261972.1 glutaredoxin family protein [Aurantiacibacter sp. 219JJ12-13]
MNDLTHNQESKARGGNTARLYRMVMDKHVCPYGLKAKWLLEKNGYSVEDHHLTTREETDAFKQKHDVKTTPQVFIGDERIGGYDALRAHFGNPLPDDGEKSYQPVIAVFAVAFGLALALSWWAFGTPLTIRAAEWFVAFSMAMLAMLKLQDVEQFSSMFLGYDLLAKRWVPYAYLYPFMEAGAAILMAGRLLPWLSIPVALFIGTIGAASVIYAVYIQKREIKCACVGGSGNVPLGFVSLTENLAMMAMGIWMLVRPAVL